MPKRQRDATVFLSNISEDVWPFIMSISDKKARAFEIEENAFLSDRDLYSLSIIPHAHLITASPIDPDFFNYVMKLTDSEPVAMYVPTKHTGEICTDCINDKKLFAKIVELGKSVQTLNLISYSTSPQFLKLVEQLRTHGVNVSTPESSDREHAWTVNYLGSKTGIRQLGQKHTAKQKFLVLSDGVICAGIEQIAQIAAAKYRDEGAVVVKTNKGHSGAGVLIYKNGELPDDYEECVEALTKTMKQDEYWDLFPAVVESYVKPDFSIAGGFPNIECRVLENGKVKVLYACGLSVNDKGVFHGIEIPPSTMPKRILDQSIKVGKFLGKKYSEMGYRGFFDVDFIMGADGKLYLTESNVRRTGGTYAYEATLNLIGSRFMTQSYSLSNSSQELSKRDWKFKEIHTLLEPVLFNKETKEGIILTTANILKQHKLAYIVFGKDKQRALAIVKKMKKLIE